jgi:hypothetical protein
VVSGLAGFGLPAIFLFRLPLSSQRHWSTPLVNAIGQRHWSTPLDLARYESEPVCWLWPGVNRSKK